MLSLGLGIYTGEEELLHTHIAEVADEYRRLRPVDQAEDDLFIRHVQILQALLYERARARQGLEPNMDRYPFVKAGAHDGD